MKGMRIILALTVLIIATIACTESSPAAQPTARATSKPAPTPQPVEAACFTGDDFEFVAETVSGWNMNFTKDAYFEYSWMVDKQPQSIMSLSYETDSNGCLLMAGTVTVIDWATGSFEDAGVFHGIVAGVGSEAYGSWVNDLIIKGCINTEISKSESQWDGSSWYFECNDGGDFVGISSMYIFP